ncbi:MAG: GntR family transcriptional regulator [Tissierellia bacterium]|nr:GntR family transcriptional regulator [Tissierellia bacterium]
MKKNIPLYQMIYNDLLKKIKDNYYPIGSVIPTEFELAEKYQVSRPTVRRAIGLLADSGYVQRKKREGTKVINRKIPQSFTHVIQSYNQEMEQKGLIPKTNVLGFSIENASTEVADALDIEVAAKVYKLIRLRFTNDAPIVIVTTYLPEKLLPGLNKYDFRKESLYDTLENYNIFIEHIKRTLNVTGADQLTSALLDIGEGDPIFRFHSIGYARNGLAVEYSISMYRGDLNSFIFELNN